MTSHTTVIRKHRIMDMMSKKEAHSYLLNLASLLDVNLRESDLKETKNTE
jgi:hypothetical protein